MMSRRQSQKGGSGAQQVQVAGDLVLGVTEKRAAEIAREQSLIVIREFTAEAAAEANARMENLDEKVVNELSGRGLLTAFSDPAFQLLLRKTLLHAASTSDDADHELLSKLLSERAGKSSKPMHMVVSRAVEVVEYIDPEALTGMMFLWFVTSVGPSLSDPMAGLPFMDSLVSKLLADGELPTGPGWLQRLDLMDCIHYRPPGLQAMNKWQDILTTQRPGYVCEGIQPDEVDAIRVKLNRVIPNLSSVVTEHPFLPGCFRINALSSAQILQVLALPLDILHQIKEQLPQQALNQLQIPLLIEALGTKSELERILAEAKVDAISAEAVGNMLKYVESELANLQKLRSWWDDLSGVIEITPVGIAIAFSNAKRFDPLQGLASLSEMIGA
jgi:hypothetical protein